MKHEKYKLFHGSNNPILNILEDPVDELFDQLTENLADAIAKHEAALILEISKNPTKDCIESMQESIKSVIKINDQIADNLEKILAKLHSKMLKEISDKAFEITIQKVEVEC